MMGVITSDRKHFSNTNPLCIAPTQVCVCVGGGGWCGRKKLGFFISGHFRIFGCIATI